MADDLRIPRYLNSLPQLAWWEIDEIMPSVALLGMGLMFEHLLPSLLAGLAITRVLQRVKVFKPDGYLFHLLYVLGLQNSPEFPAHFHEEFIE